jgi:hypothetical protein
MTPSVDLFEHDISLPIESQLILEMELGKLGAECDDVFLGGRRG